jgi:hypothetical protein
MPSTLIVTSNLDSGPGSLRADIAAANSGDTIEFAPGLAGQTIRLTTGELSITEGLTIRGLGASQLTVSGNNPFRVFEVNATQPVAVSGLTISVGLVGFRGWGGGIFNHTTLTVSGCNFAHNFAIEGGGIANVGTLTVSGCTFAGDNGFNGGGGILNAGNASLTNCTFSNNRTKGTVGGGVFATAGTTTLTNCTLSLNVAGQGGGIYVTSGAILNLTNTIVAGNTASVSGPDIYGAVATADHSLVGDATGSSGIVNGVNGNIVGGNGNPVINALLGPLQNNGGPTQTMALLAGSPAIGQAENSKAPAADQRGVTRLDVAGEMTDIGAFEL